MSSNREKSEWLKEHLKYEIQMMRRTFQDISGLANGIKVHPKLQYEYNLAYESFILHARNLADFLQNSGGSTNYKANDFVSGFKTKNYQRDMLGPMDALHRQVFHMAKNRPAGGDAKFNAQKCGRVRNWLEAQLDAFKAALVEPYRTDWQAIEPHLGDVAIAVPKDIQASQSSCSTSVTSGTLGRR